MIYITPTGIILACLLIWTAYNLRKLRNRIAKLEDVEKRNEPRKRLATKTFNFCHYHKHQEPEINVREDLL